MAEVENMVADKISNNDNDNEEASTTSSVTNTCPHLHPALVPEAEPKQVVTFDDANEAFTWFKLKISNELQQQITSRVGHGMVFSRKTQKLLMIGGGNHAGDTKEVWTFDNPTKSSPFTGTLNQRLTEDFTGLYEFLCSYNCPENDEEHETVWLFGGADFHENKNDVLRLDLNEESLVKYFSEEESSSDKNVPAPRTQGHNSCFLNIKGDKYLVVFGGGQRGEKAISDGNIYMFSIKDKTWKRVEVTGTTPNPVQGHAMASIDTKVFVHGGMDNFLFSDDLFVIDLNEEKPSWCKLSTAGPRPSPRAAHAMISLEKCFYVCSGVNDEGAIMDVWKFHSEAMEWTCLSHPEQNPTMVVGQYPSPRTDFAMCLVKVKNQTEEMGKNMLLIHGGMNTFGILFDDFWVFPLD